MINRERTRAAMSSSRGKFRPFIRASLDSVAMKQTSVRSSLRTRRRCLREDVHVNHVIILHVNLNTGLIQSDPYHCPSGRRRLIKFLSQCTSTAQHFLVRVSTLVATGCTKLFLIPWNLDPLFAHPEDLLQAIRSFLFRCNYPDSGHGPQGCERNDEKIVLQF
ncbi:conserved hypothetical protein [Trichinella spiralis]|uniref:hypothetical protein n=1 Tax=Trichinella spiralis TaxID=6334 RepID=UPI0001EFE815|nr:conserved hypothetical protein [Trichinella spiralis]